MRYVLCATLLALAAIPARAQVEIKPNTLTPKEIAEGRILLFDGETTFGWKTEGEVKVLDGLLVLGGGKKSSVETTSRFLDYEVSFEASTDGKTSFHAGWRSRESGHTYNVPTPPEGWSKCILRVRGSEGKEGLDVSSFGRFSSMVPRVTGQFLKPGTSSSVVLGVDAGNKIPLRNIKLRLLGLKSIFNGKDLTGWKEFPGKKSKFTVNAKGELNVKDGPGDLQTEGKWGDFVLQFDCISNGKHLNSGLFFRCIPGQYQQGYEAQIRNEFTAEPKEYVVEDYDPATHKLLGKKKVPSTAVDYGTGAIYRRVPARKQASKDGEWFTMTIVAQGNHFATWVNGIQQVDWTDNRPPADNARNGYRAEAGPISLQGHDPTTDLSFRNFRIAELPPQKR